MLQEFVRQEKQRVSSFHILLCFVVWFCATCVRIGCISTIPKATLTDFLAIWGQSSKL